MKVIRISAMVMLVLSAFLTVKSFVAVHNVEVWSDDLTQHMVNDHMVKPSHRSPVQFYTTRLDAIQKEWSIVRWVGLACVGLSLLAMTQTFLSPNIDPK